MFILHMYCTCCPNRRRYRRFPDFHVTRRRHFVQTHEHPDIVRLGRDLLNPDTMFSWNSTYNHDQLQGQCKYLMRCDISGLMRRCISMRDIGKPALDKRSMRDISNLYKRPPRRLSTESSICAINKLSPYFRICWLTVIVEGWA